MIKFLKLSNNPDEIGEILRCCHICYPDAAERTSAIHPNVFDREMSRHLLEKHFIK